MRQRTAVRLPDSNIEERQSPREIAIAIDVFGRNSDLDAPKTPSSGFTIPSFAALDDFYSSRDGNVDAHELRISVSNIAFEIMTANRSQTPFRHFQGAFNRLPRPGDNRQIRSRRWRCRPH
jgi:hypothetical protein